MHVGWDQLPVYMFLLVLIRVYLLSLCRRVLHPQMMKKPKDMKEIKTNIDDFQIEHTGASLLRMLLLITRPFGRRNENRNKMLQLFRNCMNYDISDCKCTDCMNRIIRLFIFLVTLTQDHFSITVRVSSFGT
jgi:hypothetical protein